MYTPRGVANGEPFQAQTIMFRQDQFPDWRLSISDHRFDVLIGAGIERSTQKNLQTIYIDLPHEPTTGGIYEKEMSYGGGYSSGLSGQSRNGSPPSKSPLLRIPAPTAFMRLCASSPALDYTRDTLA